MFHWHPSTPGIVSKLVCVYIYIHIYIYADWTCFFVCTSTLCVHWLHWNCLSKEALQPSCDLLCSVVPIKHLLFGLSTGEWRKRDVAMVQLYHHLVSFCIHKPSFLIQIGKPRSYELRFPTIPTNSWCFSCPLYYHFFGWAIINPY